jgi:hypothetical protein
MRNIFLFIATCILLSASLFAFTLNKSGSPLFLSANGSINQTQGGLLELGLYQIVTDNSVANTIGTYQDIIQLVNYEGRPLTGLTFDLISRGKVIMTPLTFNDAFNSDNWIITTTINRGHILADGSSLDTIHAVLFSTGSASINPTTKTIIATFGYNTVKINTASDTTSIQLQNISGAAVDTLGWPIEAGLKTNDYQRIIIDNLTTISIAIGTPWNMVAVPVVPSTLDANTQFPGKSGTIFAFNTSTQGYISALTLTNGQGYWAKYTASGSNSITGSVVSGTTVTVAQAGWVLLGSMSNAVNVSALITVSAGAITGSVFRFNPTTQGYVSTTVINPGEAVWVKVNQACTITYP